MKVIEVTCSDRDVHRSRLAARRRGLSEYPEPTWDDVVRRMADAEPWTSPRLVVDSARPIDDIVGAALTHLSI